MPSSPLLKFSRSIPLLYRLWGKPARNFLFRSRNFPSRFPLSTHARLFEYRSSFMSEVDFSAFTFSESHRALWGPSPLFLVNVFSFPLRLRQRSLPRRTLPPSKFPLPVEKRRFSFFRSLFFSFFPYSLVRAAGRTRSSGFQQLPESPFGGS